MASLQVGGFSHQAFCRSAIAAVRGSRMQLVHSASKILKDSAKANLRAASFCKSANDLTILLACKIYRDCVLKAGGPPRFVSSPREGTKSYVVFQKVVSICKAEGWLLGEYISAQFSMIGANRTVLLSHLASKGALYRFKKFQKMFGAQPIRASSTTSEKQTIERATMATCQNLTALLLAKGKAFLNEDDFSFCDRYTLAYFHRTSMLPKSQLFLEVAKEVDNLYLFEARWDALKQFTRNAALSSIEKLRQRPSKIKSEVIEVISSLYGV